MHQETLERPGGGGCASVNGQEEAAPPSQVPRRPRPSDWLNGHADSHRDRLGQSKAGPIADGVVKTRHLNQGTSWLVGWTDGGVAEKKAIASPCGPCGQRSLQKWTEAASLMTMVNENHYIPSRFVCRRHTCLCALDLGPCWDPTSLSTYFSLSVTPRHQGDPSTIHPPTPNAGIARLTTSYSSRDHL